MEREKLEVLARLLRDAQRKAAQYYADDRAGMYDDITEALSMVQSAPAVPKLPQVEVIQRGSRIITFDE
jgi:hypothetical protein